MKQGDEIEIMILDTLFKNKLTAQEYEDLNELIGISKILLGKYKNDPLRIPAEDIIKIAAVCKCPEQEIIDAIKSQSASPDALIP
jgi:hypothetical protein